ncbi:MAG: sulfotransferase [Sulfurimonas sp.]|nr:sulfotransferase [Sulfurimonas sp.]
MKTAIFILGMHRSGTSALAGVLERLGIELGSELYPAGPDNEKGFFENVKVLELNKKILSENNSAYDDTNFYFSINKDLFNGYVAYAVQILEEEFLYSKLFAIKDPRLCLTFPVWEAALKQLNIDVRIILPYRNPFEVAKSLKSRNLFSVEKSLLLWTKHFYSAEYFSRNYKRIFIDFDALVHDLEAQVLRIQNFLGLENGNQNNIIGFIESRLKHKNISYDNIKDSIPSFIKEIILLMKNVKLDEAPFGLFDQLREQYIATAEIFYSMDVLADLEVIKNLREANAFLSQKLEYLEQLGHKAVLDTDYYLAENTDVREAGIDPLRHFVESGFYEERYPNEYCKINKIKPNEISKIDKKFYEMYRQLNIAQNFKVSLEQDNSQKQQELEQKTQELEQSSQTIQTLATQKAEIENNYAQKLQEISVLNASLEEMNNTLSSTIETNAQQKAELEIQIAEINQELQTTSQNLEQTQKEKETLLEQNSQKQQELVQKTEELEQKQQELEQKTQELEQSSQTIQTLQTQKAEIENNYAQKLQEIKELDVLFDETMNDLENVKEMLGSDIAQKQQEIEQKTEEIEQKTQELEQSSQTIQTLQTQKAEIENSYSISAFWV